MVGQSFRDKRCQDKKKNKGKEERSKVRIGRRRVR